MKSVLEILNEYWVGKTIELFVTSYENGIIGDVLYKEKDGHPGKIVEKVTVTVDYVDLDQGYDGCVYFLKFKEYEKKFHELSC